MNRKRTHEVAFYEPVTVPFRKKVRAGDATFTIDVPKSHQDMRFFFSSFNISPDLYSTEAALENLEDPEQGNTLVTYDVYMKNVFVKKDDFYPGTFELDKAVTKTATLISSANAFFEGHKPDICPHLAAFFDWTDERFKDYRGSFKDFMNNYAVEYYREPLDMAKHFNALPPSARSIEGVNNYLFPTSGVEDVRQNIRVRLWLGPNTNALLSTNGQFKAMGFDRTQIGERVGKKYQIEGDEGMGYYKLEAYNPPQFVIPKESLKNLLRIDLKIAEQVFITNNRSLKIKKKDSFKNANYATLLKEGLGHFFEDTNTMVDVSYDDRAKKFKFIFPPNQNILQTSVMLTRDLAERLGFGLVDSISQANAQGNRVEDDIDVKRTESKARALGYDTGMILVTNESKTSNNVIGISDQLMCTVYPNAVGVYEISPLESCFSPPTMSLPNFYSGGQNEVAVPFKLYRFLDNSEPAKLDLKNGAFVSGQLRGTKPQQQV